MLRLDERSAEEFVRKTFKARWDGWDIVIHNPSHRAWDSPDGRFHNGKWGFEQRISPGVDGLWKVTGKIARAYRAK